jgi:hypothetical protein
MYLCRSRKRRLKVAEEDGDEPEKMKTMKVRTSRIRRRII